MSISTLPSDPPARRLRTLLVEDSNDDAELLMRTLRNGGFRPCCRRVDTAEAMSDALSRDTWDVVIADYVLPHFSGPAALQLVQKSGLDLPFIVVSGAVGEEVAVAAMKAGAHDFVLKNKLARLVPAIERELRDAEVRRECARAEEAVRRQETYFRSLIVNALDLIAVLNLDGTARYVSPSHSAVLGYRPEDLMGVDLFAFFHPDDMAALAEQLANGQPGDVADVQFRFRHRDGSWRVMEARAKNMANDPIVAGVVVNSRDVTKRVEAEEALRRSEERFALAVAGANDGVWDWNLETGEVYFSRRCKSILGYDRDETTDHIGKLLARVHPEDHDAVAAAFVAHLNGLTPHFEHEHRLRHKDGTYCWVLARGLVVRDPNGKACRIAGSIADITERKWAEEALRKSEERFAVAVAGANDGVWDWNLRSGEQYFSPRCKGIIGYEDDELPDDIVEWGKRIHPDDLDRAQSDLADHFAGVTPHFRSEYRLRHKDGTYRWVVTRGLLLRDADGTPCRLAGSHADITERKCIELALRQSEANLQTIFNNSLQSFILLDPAATVRAFNQIASVRSELFFMTQPLTEGAALPDFVPASLAAECMGHFVRALAGETVITERVIPDATGTDHWFEFNYIPVHDAETVSGVCLSALDITERKRAEEALRASEERYRRLVELSPDGIVVHTDGKITFINDAAVQLLGGHSARDFTGRPFLELVHSDSRPLVERRLLQLEREGRALPTAEERFVRLNGSNVDLEVVTSPLNYGGKAAAQVILHDVTERRLMEEQLRQSQKMEAVGQLAGGIAHDFNNQLTIIKGCAQFLQAALPTDAPSRRDVERINATVERGARLVRQLLAFGRKQSVETVSVDLNQLLTEMLPVLRLLTQEQLVLRSELSPGLWTVRVDPAQIEQVILNLVANAKDAMMVGELLRGTLTIATTNVPCHSGRSDVHSSPLLRDAVLLTVSDTGCGMSAAVRERAFEPFFTTKEIGKGTGLGLAMVYGIVQQHRGKIVCDSEPGSGATFRIYLPRDETAASAVPQRPALHDSASSEQYSVAAARRPIGRQDVTVLVVDDEELVRTVIQEALQKTGCRVRVAAQIEEALAVAATLDAPIDLLITDIDVSDGNGTALARRLRPNYPNMKILFISGYPDNRYDERNLPEARFLPKPFSLDLLLRYAAELLES